MNSTSDQDNSYVNVAAYLTRMALARPYQRAVVYPAGRDRSPNVAMREGPWKLLIQADGTKPELYNVVTDRGESRNVARDHPELTAELSRQALEWRRSLPAANP